MRNIKMVKSKYITKIKKNKLYYIHVNYRIGIFRFSFYKLGKRFTVRFEISRGWDN